MKLSIITINWNNREGLRLTMDSVLAQSARDQFEYIVIDGGSTDGSVDEIQARNPKIDKWVSEEDRGIYHAMNKGVAMSIGEYCLFLNSGDSFHNDTVIQEVLAHLQKVDFVIGKMVFLETGDLFVIQDDLNLLHFLKGSLPHNATFIKREWLMKYPYDESLKIVSDWKLFVQSFILGNASYELVDVTISDFDCNGISSKNRDLCVIEKEKVLKELFPPRILADYRHFLNGGGYKDTDYDRFYVKLRNYKYGKVLYRMNLFIMRFVAIFKKSARFTRNYSYLGN